MKSLVDKMEAEDVSPAEAVTIAETSLSVVINKLLGASADIPNLDTLTGLCQQLVAIGKPKPQLVDPTDDPLGLNIDEHPPTVLLVL